VGAKRDRYVARAEAGVGWQVWDTGSGRKWGNPYREYPEALLRELNGAKDPARLVALARNTIHRKRR
jgi:hypothetical protein